MDKYRPCPSIIAMFTSDSQHPPRSKHAVYLGGNDFFYPILTLMIDVILCECAKEKQRHMNVSLQ